MNTSLPDPDELDDLPAIPSGEMPDMDDLPADEPSGPPAATTNPFGIPMINGSVVSPRVIAPSSNVRRG